MTTTEERPKLNQNGGDGDFINSRRLYHGAAPYIIGKSVLDFGCGYGHGSYFLHPWALKITGFDLHKPVVDKANELFGSETLRYTHDLESLTEPIDMVISIEAIEHLEKDDLDKQLAWFASKAPSIYCTTPNGNVFPYQPKTKAERRGYHIWHYTETELVVLFRKHYSFVDIHAVLRDPRADHPKGRWMGYAIYASNAISTPDNFLHDYEVRAGR